MPRLQYHHDMEYANFHNPYNHQSILQTFAFEPTFFHFPQNFFKYTEPLELTTASPLDLSLKSHQPSTPITPPCTPSPGQKKLSQNSPTTSIDVPLKKPKFTNNSPSKKNKVTRKLNFDEDNSSPVSGTIIRELGPDEHLVVRKGDIDPAFNVVEITEEAKAELAKIENLIGDYVCRYISLLYSFVFWRNFNFF